MAPQGQRTLLPKGTEVRSVMLKGHMLMPKVGMFTSKGRIWMLKGRILTLKGRILMLKGRICYAEGPHAGAHRRSLTPEVAVLP